MQKLLKRSAQRGAGIVLGAPLVMADPRIAAKPAMPKLTWPEIPPDDGKSLGVALRQTMLVQLEGERVGLGRR